jgi:uncharacterized protein (DUF433 family)
MVMVLQSPLVKKIQPVDPDLLAGDRIERDHPLFGLIWINPERMSGTPCFYGTRVPIKTLFDCLAEGQSLAEFLDDFEGVSQEQAKSLLQLAANDLLCHLEMP